MTTISYLFNNQGKIGLDECDITNKQIQDNESVNYMLNNFMNYNSFTEAKNIANNQPNIFLCGSTTGGVSAKIIDDNSKLQIVENTNKCDQEKVHSRLFLTTPYLGKGPFDVNASNELSLDNKLHLNRKTNDPNSEVTHDKYVYYPLIPALESTVTNPNNLVEGVAQQGWVRGGVPSRLLNKMQDEKN